MQQQISQLQAQFEQDISTNSDIDALYLKYLSKTHGLVTNLLKKLPAMNPNEKKKWGPQINKLKNELETKLSTAAQSKKEQARTDPLIDLTLPKSPQKSGYLHPTTQIIRKMNKFFRYHGFSVSEGPEIETAEYNFRKLNLPEGHPATDLQDTLFIQKPNILLRTHTSSIEARVLTEYKPPIRAAFPGKVYRNETLNKTNAAFFHHYQGVVVDSGITIQHLKHTLTLFHKFLFGEDIELRFRYKYYPEVSPGMGVDMKCKFCYGKGCDVCKHRGWMEILGSGMIHYNTLKMCGIDPTIYTGFAFGMGLDRLVMQKFGIGDIRKLYEGGIAYV
jgi:phenylalanyl-tRNA synthetase alpha chain